MADDKCRSQLIVNAGTTLYPNSQNTPRCPSFVWMLLDFAAFEVIPPADGDEVLQSEPMTVALVNFDSFSATAPQVFAPVTCWMGDPHALSVAVMAIAKATRDSRKLSPGGGSRAAAAVIYVSFQNCLPKLGLLYIRRDVPNPGLPTESSLLACL